MESPTENPQILYSLALVFQNIIKHDVKHQFISAKKSQSRIMKVGIRRKGGERRIPKYPAILWFKTKAASNFAH